MKKLIIEENHSSLSGRRLLRTGEVAKILNLHPNTIRTMIERGELHPIRHHGGKGHYRFYEDDILNLLSEKGEKYSTRHHIEEDISFEEKLFLESQKDITLFAKEYTVDSNFRKFLEMFIKSMNPIYIFGSQLEPMSKYDYSKQLLKRDTIWIYESLRNCTRSGTFNTKFSYYIMEMLSEFVSIAMCKVADEYTFAFLINIDGSKTLFDGTIQQHFTDLNKGILVLKNEEIEKVYEECHEIEIKTFLEYCHEKRRWYDVYEYAKRDLGIQEGL